MNELVSSVISILSVTPARWQALAEVVPADLLKRPAAPGEWSALECLEHLIDVEISYQARVQAFLAGNQKLPAVDQDLDDSLLGDASSMAAEYLHLREKTLRILSTLTVEDLSRISTHPKFGPVTLGEMLHTWAAHDLNHTVQAERALMQPFIAGSGPWKVFFTDHTLPQE
jgi:hypothetical protein